MSKQYSIEFAVESSTEIKAMNRLKSLGIENADEAKLSDLDRQAGLFFIKVFANEADLTDEIYHSILNAEDIFILSDELSAKRAQQIIELTSPVEEQLKKLLICVLPETEKVLSHIIQEHQRHKTDTQAASRIEWSKKISDFSFGELPKVLEEDISELAKKQLLSSEGLLSLIASAKDFDALKGELIRLSQPKTVWKSVCTVLEKPVEYEYLAGQLADLCKARNEAAHLNTITVKRLNTVKKSQKHVMSCIGQIKSSYRDDLRANMDTLAKSMKSILESAVKIDPSIFTGYQQMISETFKPFTETISKLQLDITSPAFTDAIKQNTEFQIEIAKSMTDSVSNMIKFDSTGYQEIMRDFTSTGISETMASYMKLDIDKSVNEKASQRHNLLTTNSGETDEILEKDPEDIDASEKKK